DRRLKRREVARRERAVRPVACGADRGVVGGRLRGGHRENGKERQAADHIKDPRSAARYPTSPTRPRTPSAPRPPPRTSSAFRAISSARTASARCAATAARRRETPSPPPPHFPPAAAPPRDSPARGNTTPAARR